MSKGRSPAAGSRASARGPRTVEGRQRALAARLRGKLPHSVAIVPGIETAEEWDAFRLDVVTQYEPVGTLETELADRIAHLLWRLRRFARYEAERAAWRMRTASFAYQREVAALTEGLLVGSWLRVALPQPPEEHANSVRNARWLVEAIGYYGTPDAEAEAGTDEQDDGERIVQTIAFANGAAAARLGQRKEDGSWTVAEIRQVVRKIAEDAAESPAAVVARGVAAAGERLKQIEAAQARSEGAVAAYRGSLLLPSESEIHNAARWESHLERSLCRMMDRLERLQRMRAGEVVSPPVLLDVTGST